MTPKMFRLIVLFGLVVGVSSTSSPVSVQCAGDDTFMPTGPESVLQSCVIPGAWRLGIYGRKLVSAKKKDVFRDRLVLRAEAPKDAKVLVLWGPIDSTYAHQVCAALRADVEPPRFAICSLELVTGLSSFREFDVSKTASDEPPNLELDEIKPWLSAGESKPHSSTPDWAWFHNCASVFRSEAMIKDKLGTATTSKYGLRLRQLRWNEQRKVWEIVFLAGKDTTITFSRGEKEVKWRMSE